MLVLSITTENRMDFLSVTYVSADETVLLSFPTRASSDLTAPLRSQGRDRRGCAHDAGHPGTGQPVLTGRVASGVMVATRADVVCDWGQGPTSAKMVACGP